MSRPILGNASLTQFDALIVGSGMGASAAADILCAWGKKVLMIEAGANRFDGLDDPDPGHLVCQLSNDEVKCDVRGVIDPDPLAEPRTFRTAPSDGDRLVVGDVNGLPKTVGGGAVHADLKMVRFRPTDFQLGTLLGAIPGANFADWPLSYDELEPFYLHVEWAMGVQGQAGADPIEPPRSGPFPMPPGLPMYVGVLATQGAQKLGYTAFPFPAAVTSRPWEGRPACADCGFCSGYGCPINAKGSPAVTTLRRALLSGNCQLWPETRAVKLLMNGAGTAVTGVQALGYDGQPVQLTADRYLLAASPIEDARLLLLSDPGGAGVGNSSGLVGRNLTFHLETDLAGIFQERVHAYRGKGTCTALTDFRGVPNDPSHPLGGIVEVGGPVGPLVEASGTYTGGLGYSGTRLKALMRQSPFRDRVLGLTMHGEDAPQATNRVDLDPAVRDLDGLPVARVTYANHAFELNARQFYLPKLIQLLGAAGATWAFAEPIPQVPASAHIMGTLRFGADPAQSVCDPTGRFHDVGNLWNCDGALFPTSSGFNPSLTIASLAAYVAGGILFPGSPARALE